VLYVGFGVNALSVVSINGRLILANDSLREVISTPRRSQQVNLTYGFAVGGAPA
jgi:hypothetical protein